MDSVSFGLIGKAAGFLVPIAVAARYGISADTDALYLAMAVTQLLVTVFSQGLEQYLIPFYVQAGGESDSRTRLRWATLRALIAAMGAWVAGLPLIWLLATHAAAAMGIRLPLLLYLLLAPQVVAAAFTACRSSYLMAHGDFRWPPASIGLRAAGVLGAIALAPAGSGIAPLAIGFSAGELLRALALALLTHRQLRAQPAFTTTSAIPPGSLRRGLWQLGSVALLGVAPLIERSLAALLAPGGVTTLEYASKLFYVAATIFDTNFAAVFVRTWAVEVRDQRWRLLGQDVRRWVTFVGLSAVVVAVIAVFAREPIVHLTLARGQFTARDSHAVASLFAILMLAYPFAAVGMLLGGLVVALHETRALFQVSALKMAVRGAAALGLGTLAGLPGIAAALVIMHATEVGFLAWTGRRTVRVRRASTFTAPA